MKKRLYVKIRNKNILIAIGKEKNIEQLKKRMENDKLKMKKLEIEEIYIK